MLITLLPWNYARHVLGETRDVMIPYVQDLSGFSLHLIAPTTRINRHPYMYKTIPIPPKIDYAGTS